MCFVRVGVPTPARESNTHVGVREFAVFRGRADLEWKMMKFSTTLFRELVSPNTNFGK